MSDHSHQVITPPSLDCACGAHIELPPDFKGDWFEGLCHKHDVHAEIDRMVGAHKDVDGLGE